MCWRSRVLPFRVGHDLLLLLASAPADMRGAEHCPECVTGVVPVSPTLQLTFLLYLHLSDRQVPLPHAALRGHPPGGIPAFREGDGERAGSRHQPHRFGEDAAHLREIHPGWDRYREMGDAPSCRAEGEHGGEVSVGADTCQEGEPGPPILTALPKQG